MPLLLSIHRMSGAYNDPRNKVVLMVLEARGSAQARWYASTIVDANQKRGFGTAPWQGSELHS